MLKNIKFLRDELNISQQKLASEIGMSQQSINAYENNNVEPDILTLVKIADFFNTSVDFIIEHTNIRRKIENVSKFDLNKQESDHIENYRKLPITTRKIVDDLIKEILKK